MKQYGIHEQEYVTYGGVDVCDSVTGTSTR
jgi:hypothetical protein